MAFTFNSNPAKEAFGKVKKIGYASDYITNKKAKMVFYKNLQIDGNVGLMYPCERMSTHASYETRNLFNRGKLLKNIRLGRLPVLNNSNLEVNLFTKENLTNVDVISEKTPAPAYPPNQNITQFYYSSMIDPCGELFGNSQCGINNFVHTLQSNPIKYYTKNGKIYAYPSIKKNTPSYICDPITV